jgi:hypothetical protein
MKLWLLALMCALLGSAAQAAVSYDTNVYYVNLHFAWSNGSNASPAEISTHIYWSTDAPAGYDRSMSTPENGGSTDFHPISVVGWSLIATASPGVTNISVSPTNAPPFQSPLMRRDQEHYFIATAVNTAGLESDPSNMVDMSKRAVQPGGFFLLLADTNAVSESSRVVPDL